jgi:hypothetical protein
VFGMGKKACIPIEAYKFLNLRLRSASPAITRRINTNDSTNI